MWVEIFYVEKGIARKFLFVHPTNAPELKNIRAQVKCTYWEITHGRWKEFTSGLIVTMSQETSNNQATDVSREK